VKHDVLRPVKLGLLLEDHMKIIALVALFGLLGGALLAEDTNESCDPVEDLTQLEPLSDEEQIVLAQLEEIQSDPVIVKQAQQEAKIPLDAFGGC
jgi:hypothetical protein